MKTKAEIKVEVANMVATKASARNIPLDSQSQSWIVNTLLADIACNISENRIKRHLNSMLTRVKTEIRAG